MGGDAPPPTAATQQADESGTSSFASGVQGHSAAFVCAPFPRPLGGASEGRALALTANGGRDFLVSLNPPPTWVTVALAVLGVGRDFEVLKGFNAQESASPPSAEPLAPTCLGRRLPGPRAGTRPEISTTDSAEGAGV